MGPVFAFCETAMNYTFIDFSIEAKCLDGAAPLHCCVVGSRRLRSDGGAVDATSPLNGY
jgi:hypothetical protein